MHVPYTSFSENFAAESDICTKMDPPLEKRLKVCTRLRIGYSIIYSTMIL